MAKKKLKISTILLISLLAITVIQSLVVAAEVDVGSINSALTLSGNPLSDEQIKTTWPNIPSAKAIYENDFCAYIDLRYCGKQATSNDGGVIDSESPTMIDMKSFIHNRTATLPDYVNGGLKCYMPQIWLQYDENIWVKVPYKYLLSSTVLSVTETDEEVTTWSVGMYSNPADIAGNNDIWGVCSFGEWNSATFGSSTDYLGTCVLTAITNDNIGFQEVMHIDSGGRGLVYNVWNLTSNQFMDSDGGYISNAVSGNLYNTYIRYNETTDAWQLWWNWTFIWSFTGDDLGTRVIKESQPFVVVESNDFDSTDFSSFSTTIGGTSGNNRLAATAFLFNGAWKPITSGDYAPAGYVYLGSSTVNGIQVGTTSPPTNWGTTNIGISSGSREVLEIGAGLTQRSHGYTLWTYGTV